MEVNPLRVDLLVRTHLLVRVSPPRVVDLLGGGRLVRADLLRVDLLRRVDLLGSGGLRPGGVPCLGVHVRLGRRFCCCGSPAGVRLPLGCASPCGSASTCSGALTCSWRLPCLCASTGWASTFC